MSREFARLGLTGTTSFQGRMRKFIQERMGRPNLRSPLPFAPPNQPMPNPSGRFALKRESITSQFNKLSVQLLVQAYISAGGTAFTASGERHEEIESYFFYYLGHIYSRALKLEDEQRREEIKRAARHSQRKQKARPSHFIYLPLLPDPQSFL